MEEADFEARELEHLANIEGELQEIKRRTPSGFRALLNGILSGGGAIIGAILTVILIGWVLYFFNILGFAQMASYLSSVLASIQHR